MDGATDGSAPGAVDRETAATAGDRLELRVWLRLLSCANRIEQGVRRELRAGSGMTLPRFDLLSQLERAPAGLTMGELSRRLMVTRGNVTGLIDRLVEEGLVERTPLPTDRRAQVVTLTPAGAAVFRATLPNHEAAIAAQLGAMKRADLRQLQTLLGRLKDRLPDRLPERLPDRLRDRLHGGTAGGRTPLPPSNPPTVQGGDRCPKPTC